MTHLKLRILSLAVIASLGAGPVLAADHDHHAMEANGLDLDKLETAAQGGNAMAASKLASVYLKSADPLIQAKALDVLSACDGQMHPICRVDLGLAYGRLALREDLEHDQRQQMARQSAFRITHAAGMGNREAVQLLQDLRNAGLSGRTAAAAASGHAQHQLAAVEAPAAAPERQLAPTKLEKPGPVRASAKASAEDRQPTRPKLIPVSHAPGFAALASAPMPMFTAAAATPPEPQQYSHATMVDLQDKLEQAMDQLQVARMQLEESNKTITALRTQIQGKQPPNYQQVDAAALNRQALEAAMDGNYETAIPLFRRAAELNHAGAINNLAAMFVNGTGVARDMQQALTLFERSADLGNAEAAENAARIYNYGIGRGKDPSRARNWYGKAITLGSRRALAELSEMERNIEAGQYF